MAAPIVLIPARLASSRLPGKALLDIGGKPLILCVWETAIAAAPGPVAVATDSPEIASVIRAVGGIVVMTRADHPNGTSRLAQAARILKLADHDIVVNVQGDEPEMEPAFIKAAVAALIKAKTEVATVALPFAPGEDATNPNIVKVVGSPIAPRRLRALYFTRATAPSGDGPLYHHIGLYRVQASQLYDN